MRDFSKISPAVWHSSRFNSLPSDDGRYLYLYLLSSPHQTSAGAYHLREGYACADLSWSAQRYQHALEELLAVDLIAFDREAEVVLIKRWFKHNPPMNDNHARGMLRLIGQLPSPSIQQAASEAAQEAWETVCLEREAEAQKRRERQNASSSRVETAYLNGSRQLRG